MSVTVVKEPILKNPQQLIDYISKLQKRGKRNFKSSPFTSVLEQVVPQAAQERSMQSL